jgi:hypothetical protein
VLLAKDLIGCQVPVTDHPNQAAMAEFADEWGRGDGQHRAPRAGQTVAAHMGEGHPGQGSAAASAYDQHIPWLVGKIYQYPAR